MRTVLSTSPLSELFDSQINSHRKVRSRLPRAQRLGVLGRSIARPSIQLHWFLQLLSAEARHNRKSAIEACQRGHVAPKLLILRHGEDIFLSFSPTLLYVLDRDVSRHARS